MYTHAECLAEHCARPTWHRYLLVISTLVVPPTVGGVRGQSPLLTSLAAYYSQINTEDYRKDFHVVHFNVTTALLTAAPFVCAVYILQLYEGHSRNSDSANQVQLNKNIP